MVFKKWEISTGEIHCKKKRNSKEKVEVNLEREEYEVEEEEVKEEEEEVKE